MGRRRKGPGIEVRTPSVPHRYAARPRAGVVRLKGPPLPPTLDIEPPPTRLEQFRDLAMRVLAPVVVALSAWATLTLQWALRRRVAAVLILTAAVGVGAVAFAATVIKPAAEPPSPELVKAMGHFSRSDFNRYASRLDGGVLAIADRHAPGAVADPWGHPLGWTSLDISQPPSLGFGSLDVEDARTINSLIPTVGGLEPARPFILMSVGPERERAIFCMTQAIYYEAAREPTEGQEAVAQVVINRMRHPAYPKTICGVVYQGAERYTGCQFSFTCDGSVLRAPMKEYWARARAVAERMLNGYVQPLVGTATFYHADYVYPAWGPMLVKLNQIGAHIFYRFPGPMGQGGVFRGPYAGNELRVSLQVHNPADLPPSALPAPPGFETFTTGQAAANAPLDSNGRVRGVIAGRRTPTPEEIRRINAALGAMPEAQAAPGGAPAGPAAPAAPAKAPPPKKTTDAATPIGQR
jgi:spore germination cell wall hydrolase CwlJ-like protein